MRMSVVSIRQMYCTAVSATHRHLSPRTSKISCSVRDATMVPADQLLLIITTRATRLLSTFRHLDRG